MSSLLLDAPDKPLALDEVLERWPALRQSLLAKWDDCPLSAYFEMRYGNGWTTHPQAGGVIFHRAAAAAVRSMQKHDAMSVAVSDGLAILEDTLRQRGIPAAERVRVPLRDLPELRKAFAKFCRDNSFSIRNVVAVEERLAAPLQYTDDEGQVRDRILTGQLDLLVADPNDDAGAIVLDWKYTWALPPNHNANPDRDAPEGLSYHGYFQQKFYGWLVLKRYPAIDRVTLREFYPRKTEARKATMHRADLEKVEENLSNMALDLDRALGAGKPKRLRIPDVAPWNPQPGKHCHYCVAKLRCPIDRDVLAENFAPVSAADAHQQAAMLQVIEAARGSLREALRPWCEENGALPVRWAKGRRAFGLRSPKSGKGSPVLTFFTPEGTDRPATVQQEDKPLLDAMRDAVSEARAERDA